ncbi:TRAP transporter small permease subunit [Solemya velum gill symbiont]|uniref:TRAP transporter small permease subunit n=1 Tax=Solemya velum gill symbiont TaxID=2340 RepID=UPI000996D3E8|nr:TRAP transporter small permease subunit [Solemya velum gill symbiont]OOZ44951.1 hypothetical protein BOW37_04925 [Solemya velum gill symbiont]OOZ47490.1 hypothetical protein BOW38_02705 [Solemya velum gill symbiont]OOZ49958.1 hypothetical protein BOW39_04460 [Solemya velum gill symbiont]OOZ51697.1 hypothetical protein BOW40_06455 [Solemya velum gill symbiont]OOZ55507.1 hypothetical protein BOW41_02560 [Solemya velum gill symbiont]
MKNKIEPSVSHIPDNSHHLDVKTTRPSYRLDCLMDHVGRFFSWFWLITMAVILVSVIARYVFGQGSILLEEMTWHFYGVTWLVGLSYALVHDDHVRVDLFHERFSCRTRLWVELFGILFLMLPFIGIVLYDSIPYFMDSFGNAERSPAPDGLPARWLPKMFIVIAFVFLAIVALSRLLKCTSGLFGLPKSIDKPMGRF